MTTPHEPLSDEQLAEIRERSKRYIVFDDQVVCDDTWPAICDALDDRRSLLSEVERLRIEKQTLQSDYARSETQNVEHRDHIKHLISANQRLQAQVTALRPFPEKIARWGNTDLLPSWCIELWKQARTFIAAHQQERR